MTGNLLPATSGEDCPDAPDRVSSRGRGGVPVPPKTPAATTETQWFAAILRQFEGPLVLYVYRFVRDLERARDVVQDAFLKLLVEIRAGNRETIEPHLAEWLYTVCRNRAVDVRRKESRMVPLGETPAESFGQIEPSPGPAAALEAMDDSATASALLDHLPPNQHEVIRLKFRHGLSYKQISAVTGLSVSNVGFLIHTGIAAMRKEMTP